MDESSTVDEGIGTTELKTIDQTTDQTIDLTDDTDETETCSKASILVRVGNLEKALKCVLNLARMSGFDMMCIKIRFFFKSSPLLVRSKFPCAFCDGLRLARSHKFEEL